MPLCPNGVSTQAKVLCFYYTLGGVNYSLEINKTLQKRLEFP